MLLPRLRLPQDIASPTHGLPVEDDGEGVLRREERRWSLTKRHASHHRRTDYGLWSGLPSSTSAVQKGGHMYVSGGTHTPSSSEPVPRCFCLPRYGWFVMGVSMTYPPSSGQPCHRCAFSLAATVRYMICRPAGTGLHGLQGVSRPHAPCGYGTSPSPESSRLAWPTLIRRCRLRRKPGWLTSCPRFMAWRRVREP